MTVARPRRFSSMTSHDLMPHGIPGIRKENRYRTVIRSNGRNPSNNPNSQAPYKPKPFDKYISHLEVVPGKPGDPIFVIAELREVVPYEDFILQPARIPSDPLVYVAKAKIGPNQEGFVRIKAGDSSFSMRVGNAVGLLQEQSVEMPSYDPRRLDVKYSNNLIIASVT